MTEAAGYFACNTYSYIMSGAAEGCLSRLAELGFRAAELMVHPLHLWPEETSAGHRRALRKHAEQLGVALVALNMPNIDINVAAAAPGMRRYSLDLLSQVLQLAGDLGIPGVVIGTGKANPLFTAPLDELTGHFFAALDELAPIARRAGTALWVENMPFGFLPGTEALLSTLERYGDPAIGTVFDLANSHFVGEDLPTALRRVRAQLRLVHISDTGRRVYRHDPVGRGTVPFAAAASVLAEIGYRKPPVLEVISQRPDREIPASARKLAALGIGADQG